MALRMLFVAWWLVHKAFAFAALCRDKLHGMPKFRDQFTIRGIVVGVCLGALFCVITLRLALGSAGQCHDTGQATRDTSVLGMQRPFPGSPGFPWGPCSLLWPAAGSLQEAQAVIKPRLWPVALQALCPA
jgi:hypothetical protein